ncbi:MAG: CRISPR-associated endonuclease Cas1 [Clostridiales bacterium]|nr:CRISPR-associated endonuclease Cas1 [Clostridiales bacterium]
MVKKYKYHDTSAEYDENISEISRRAVLLDTASSVDEIMGVEGMAARHYWNCFRRLLKNPAFTRCEYRPSPDYVNALLNISYAFLANEITTCLTAKNFDLEIGFLHSIHYGRNSLALDMMEEFRSPVVDSWILSVLNKNQLKAEHFHVKNGDWRLTDEGFRKYCGLFHDQILPWREKFRTQSNNLKLALMKGETYEPYSE